MERFYYQFDASSELGKRMFRFHHSCVKADEAADDYARKMGAKAWYGDPNAFAGGVTCLEFEKGKVDLKMWRPVGVINGVQCYEPAVSVVAGAVILDDKEKSRPSDTAVRIYAKQPCGWEQVRQFYTMKQWALMIGYELTGDKEADGNAIIEKMKSHKFLSFMDFYGEQQPAYKENRRARSFLRAVRAEQQRMKLPVILTDDLYSMLMADMTQVSADDKESPSTPTFFLYNGTYYIGVAYPCRHQDLHPIAGQMYTYKQNMLKLQVMRQVELS